jgi:hypothetical protein
LKYYQCRMEQEQPDGKAIIVAWIEEKGAKVGNRVELKGEDGLWTVIHKTNHPLEGDKLIEKQAMDRRQRQGSDI